MADAKKGVIALGKHKSVTELVNEFQTNCKKLNKLFGEQCLPIEAAVTTIKAVARVTATTITDTCQGAAFGFIVEHLFRDISPPSSKSLSRCGEYQPLVKSLLSRRNLEHARNYAVILGVNSSITCVLKEIRGKEDIKTSIVAGFGYGVVLSLVTGMRGPSVMSVGVICALVNAGIYKSLQETSGPQPAEDVVHTKTRGINQAVTAVKDVNIQTKEGGEENK